MSYILKDMKHANTDDAKGSAWNRIIIYNLKQYLRIYTARLSITYVLDKLSVLY